MKNKLFLFLKKKYIYLTELLLAFSLILLTVDFALDNQLNEYYAYYFILVFGFYLGVEVANKLGK